MALGRSENQSRNHDARSPLVKRIATAAFVFCNMALGSAAPSYAQSFTEFNIFSQIPGANDFTIVSGLVVAPDGRFLFNLSGSADSSLAVGQYKLSDTGTISIQSPFINTASAPCLSLGSTFNPPMVVGPDGMGWFAANGQIGRYNPYDTAVSASGSVNLYAASATGACQAAFIGGLTLGPDGNFWFTDTTKSIIGRMNTSGQVTAYSVPPVAGLAAGLNDIVAGRDGNLWFGISTRNTIGRITTSGSITEFPIPGRVSALTSGPDGNIWFTSNSSTIPGENFVGKITPTGTVTTYPMPLQVSGYTTSYGITEGPDGNVWFTERILGAAGIVFGLPINSKLARITTSGVITEFQYPNADRVPGRIFLNAGNLYIEFVGRVSLGQGRVSRSYFARFRPVPTPPSSTGTTSATLKEGAVLSTSQNQTQSYLRFFNTGTTAGTVSVTLADSVSGQTLAQWTSPSIAAGTSPQYGLAVMEAAATSTFTKPTYYSVTMTSQFSGSLQHVLYRPSDGTLTNISVCNTGVAASTTQVANVHSGLLTNGYPSTIVLYNTGTAASAVTLGIFDSVTGTKLGTHSVAAIPANGQAFVTVAAIEAATGIKPKSDQFHYTIKIESAFTGHIQHLVTNQQVGVITDMTTTCAITAQ